MEKKKKFKETGFGKFINKAISIVPSIAGDVFDVVTSTNPVGTAISKVGELLSSKAKEDKKAKQLLSELENSRMQWEKEMYELDIEAFSLEVEDRKSARNKYINSNTSVADRLAVNIMSRNIIYIVVLLFCQIAVTVVTVLVLLKMVQDQQTAVTIGTSLGSIIGTAVGTVVGSLLQERNSVVGFHFGSSVEKHT